MNNQDQSLDECGCCEGIKPLTPVSVENLPGLKSLAYRVGTHARFKETMLSLLPGQAALRTLRTRDDDDPAISLLDGWATVLDVLSFYQERIANEGYLRTATERRSILEMARSIGYELRPGVAAGTYLAFTLETAPAAASSAKVSGAKLSEKIPGVPESATIPIGTKAQSTPAQDELPQVFETIEEIEARAAWNELKPKTTEFVPPRFGDRVLYLRGTSTNLKPGDALLVIGDERLKDPRSENWDFRRVRSVKPVDLTDPEASYTVVTLDRGLGSFMPHVEPAKKNPKVYALRQRAALFGYNAPDLRAMTETIRTGFGVPPSNTQWQRFNIAYADVVSDSLDTIYLDAVYPSIVVGSWLVLSSPDYQEVFRVSSVVEESRTEFTLTGKTTKVELIGENLKAKFGNRLRETVVFAQSEELAMAERPITTPISGNSVTLNQKVDDLFGGQFVAVSGLNTNTGGQVSEVMMLDRMELDGENTKLIFTSNLENSYQRDSVVMNANVARATHGETKQEVLGAGDGSKPFQKFVLKQKPLTYVSAPTPSGNRTTLGVRINDVLWEEVANFYQLSPEERAYITRIAEDGGVTVQFGDGLTGARLPTGTENVSAKYRVGTGMSGMLEAGQINLLMTRPLGVKGVTNPLAPTGAEDPEQLEQARGNAPLTVLTLDRIVSLQDFEDFTRAFAGIGKAQATWLWDGEKRLMHLTVAGADGDDVPPNSDLYKNLSAAIDLARHADQRVRIDSYTALKFDLDAKLLIDSQYLVEDVKAEVLARLVEAFSFERRSFGQAVTTSEVIAIAQGVEGVVAIDLDKLYFDGAATTLHQRLPAHIAHWESGKIEPGELLTVNEKGIKLMEMA